jgi:hypothetical protein
MTHASIRLRLIFVRGHWRHEDPKDLLVDHSECQLFRQVAIIRQQGSELVEPHSRSAPVVAALPSQLEPEGAKTIARVTNRTSRPTKAQMMRAIVTARSPIVL